MSTVVTELDKLATTGPVTASRVVAVASDPAHPLHSRFEWDDEKAGHEYRLIQARRLIVSVRFRVDESGFSGTIQAYVHVPTVGGVEGEYVPASILARQPERWERARDSVAQLLHAAQDGLQDLEVILQVFGSPRPQVGRASKAVGRARKEVSAITA